METTSPRMAAVLAEINSMNAADPRTDTVNGVSTPRELLYSQRMSEYLDRLYAGASDALKIAARAQHIRRWDIPRDAYPLGRTGYNAWRTACRNHHSALASDVMRRHGYDEAEVDHVAKLIQKKDLKRDPESQALENVVGAVFVAHYLAAFAEKHEEPKLLDILRKTARKMDAEGLAAIGTLDLPPHVARLIEKALG